MRLNYIQNKEKRTLKAKENYEANKEKRKRQMREYEKKRKGFPLHRSKNDHSSVCFTYSAKGCSPVFLHPTTREETELSSCMWGIVREDRIDDAIRASARNV